MYNIHSLHSLPLLIPITEASVGRLLWVLTHSDLFHYLLHFVVIQHLFLVTFSLRIHWCLGWRWAPSEKICNSFCQDSENTSSLEPLWTRFRCEVFRTRQLIQILPAYPCEDSFPAENFKDRFFFPYGLSTKFVDEQFSLQSLAGIHFQVFCTLRW